MYGYLFVALALMDDLCSNVAMRLHEYIRKVGVKGFAKAVGEQERTVISWMYQKRTPRRPVAWKIVERTGLTLEDIYGDPNKKNGRRK